MIAPGTGHRSADRTRRVRPPGRGAAIPAAEGTDSGSHHRLEPSRDRPSSNGLSPKLRSVMHNNSAELRSTFGGSTRSRASAISINRYCAATRRLSPEPASGRSIANPERTLPIDPCSRTNPRSHGSNRSGLEVHVGTGARPARHTSAVIGRTNSANPERWFETWC